MFHTFLILCRPQNGKKNSIKCWCYCGKSFRKTEYLSFHQKLKCETLKKFRKTGLVTCNKCGKTFKNLADLEKHQLNSSCAITCGSCGGGFDRIGYQEHVSSEHCFNLEKPYRCLDCGISYKVESSHSLHVEICSQKLKFTTDGNQPLGFEKVCEKCGLKFNSSKAWFCHIRECGKKKVEKHGFKWHHHKNCSCSKCSSQSHKRKSIKTHSKPNIQYSEWKANVKINGGNVDVDLGSKLPFLEDASEPTTKKRMYKKTRSNWPKERKEYKIICNQPSCCPFPSIHYNNSYFPGFFFCMGYHTVKYLQEAPLDPFEILCDIYEWLEHFLVDSEMFEWLIFHFPYIFANTIHTAICLLRMLESDRIHKHVLDHFEWWVLHFPYLLLYTILTRISRASTEKSLGIYNWKNFSTYSCLIFFTNF